MLTCVVPFSICIAALILLLIHREREHNRLVRDLINKILIERGIEPLPEPRTEVEETVVREPEVVPERVRVPIPGMAVFQAMAKRYSKVK